MSDDETLARLLQEEFDAELLATTKINDEVADFLPSSSQFSKAEEKSSGIIDPSLDLIDPNPDLHALFSQFNHVSDDLQIKMTCKKSYTFYVLFYKVNLAL